MLFVSYANVLDQRSPEVGNEVESAKTCAVNLWYQSLRILPIQSAGSRASDIDLRKMGTVSNIAPSMKWGVGQ